MTRRPFLARLAEDARGVSVVEFALISGPLMLVIMGGLELGYISYVRSVMQGALQVAAREAAIGNTSPADLDSKVKATLSPVVESKYVTTGIRSYLQFSRAGKAEKLTDDKNGNGQYDPNDCYEDANDNGKWDSATDSGRSNGGNADEVVAYTITVERPSMFPVGKLLASGAAEKITASTILRNQPFAKNVPVRTVCN